MAYSYETIDGQRVERNVAAAFKRMRTAFEKRFGLSLKVRSGTRTDAEHEKIFRERYVTAGNVRGRKVYDTRWWNGQRWYRISSKGTVAVPKTSNHQESGPNGPRSVDIYDTGRDAGVTVRGTVRDKWMEANAGKYGFENEGYKFREPWHKTFRGEIGGGAPSSKGDQDVRNRQSWLNKSRGEKLAVDGLFGRKTKAAIKRYQRFLKGSYGYSGRIDGIWGNGTQAAHQRYYDAFHKSPSKPKPQPKPDRTPPKGEFNPFGIKFSAGLQKIAALYGYRGKIDQKFGSSSMYGFARFLRSQWGYQGNDVLGPVMWKSIQRWLKARWDYRGKIDGIPGSGTRDALQRAETENFKAL